MEELARRRSGGRKQIEIEIEIEKTIEAGPAPKQGSTSPLVSICVVRVSVFSRHYCICVVAQHQTCSHAAMFTAVILICLSISVDLVLYPVGYVDLVRARACRTTLNSQGMAKNQKKKENLKIFYGYCNLAWHR